MKDHLERINVRMTMYANKCLNLVMKYSTVTAKPRILYVDDEKDNLFAFRSVFRRFFDVITAIGGSEAIELLEEEDVDLVLSDQRMPKMTGVELCKYLMDHYPKAKRIIVTGYSERAPIEDAMKIGAVSKWISKPWDVENLRHEIESALSSS